MTMIREFFPNHLWHRIPTRRFHTHIASGNKKAGQVRHFAKLVPCDTIRRGGRVVDRGGLENR